MTDTKMEGGRQVKRERQYWEKSEILKTRAARFGPKILTNIDSSCDMDKDVTSHIAYLKN